MLDRQEERSTGTQDLLLVQKTPKPSGGAYNTSSLSLVCKDKEEQVKRSLLFLTDLSLYDACVELENGFTAVTKIFTTSTNCPGVILCQQGEIVGILTREKFHQYFSKNLPVEHENWKSEIERQVLVLQGHTPIHAASKVCLLRSRPYEPVIVETQPQSYKLLAIQDLLLAQCQSHELALEDKDKAQRELAAKNQQIDWFKSKLIQLEKMAALGQLLAGVGHEINNPVNFICNNLDYAITHAGDLLNLLELYEKHYPNAMPEIVETKAEIDIEFIADDFPKLLHSMKTGTSRIKEIVLSLRNFSRSDEAEKQLVNIHDGINDTLLILQNRIKKSLDGYGIQVIKNYSYLPKVKCYVGQLSQVFMNVLSNSIDALENHFDSTSLKKVPPGTAETIPTITISTEICDRYAAITISDNGGGMSAEVQEHIFKPFFTTKPVGKGTGLGMSISREIIEEKHGGSLKFVSELGKGTEFQILIPLQ